MWEPGHHDFRLGFIPDRKHDGPVFFFTFPKTLKKIVIVAQKKIPPFGRIYPLKTVKKFSALRADLLQKQHIMQFITMNAIK